MTKHTPGPWKCEPGKDATLESQWWITSEANFRERDEYGSPFYLSVSGMCRKNDALLMAAAPDLLEALKALYAAIEQHVTYDVKTVVYNAIAKAKGEA